MIQSLNEKWEKSVQSAKIKGEKDTGGSSTITIDGSGGRYKWASPPQ